MDVPRYTRIGVGPTELGAHLLLLPEQLLQHDDDLYTDLRHLQLL